MSPAQVVVAVLTFGRDDGLRGILDALACQDVPPETTVVVLTVDNNPAPSARPVVEVARIAHADDGLTFDYAHQPRPGIPVARNTALDRAAARGADALVFIDDDTRPEAHWLVNLVQAWRDSGAQLVAGSSRRTVHTTHDPWVDASHHFDDTFVPVLARVRRSVTRAAWTLPSAPTENLLLDLAFLRRSGHRFDERIGLGGGSDLLLTSQVTRSGGRLAEARDAVVVGTVPAERYTRTWVLHRARQRGNGLQRVAWLRSRGTAERARVTARGAAIGLGALALGGIAAVGGRVVGSLPLRAQGEFAFWYGVARLAACIGVVYLAYGRTERRWGIDASPDGMP
ncbi:glycosyltransferase family A protein [Luteimicrobium subarcticum]|uniref:Glycosyl transferase family 2 n=1 Tax=Luteimicrobium subarcticum TaxID=620910 RepID=A0A2M8WV21_9MICO|nr:glycosyltransferase family A protein [Luteimicrobium subarcticum]PJI94726.1 glycosyl transferase family 2 [Luteimicrobium subarcticum]